MFKNLKNSVILVTLLLHLTIIQVQANIIPDPVSLPEPSTGSLLLLAMLAVLGCRKIFNKNK